MDRGQKAALTVYTFAPNTEWYYIFKKLNQSLSLCTVMTLSFRTDRSGQTVQTQIRLLLEEQSDQGLHCSLFHLHVFDKIPSGLVSLFEF